MWKDLVTEIIISPPKEFRFAENLNYLSRSSNECLFEIEANKIYRALPIGQTIVIVEISSPNDLELHVRFLGDTAPNKQSREEIARYIREWFDLDTNLVPFYDMAKTDFLLHQPVSQFYGLRKIAILDLFEAIAWGILGQQINLTYAYTLKRRFVERFGKHVEWEGKTYWLFPEPEVIAHLKVEDLSVLKMTLKKCEYMIGVAQLLSSGEMTKDKLLQVNDLKTAEKMLVKIHGIGPWTANYVLMRCLRSPSAFPIDDVGLHNSIKQALHREKKPTKAEILKLAEPWKGWEAYATFYLWRLLY
jgi:DNA-3-methyladenine glycosylase II